MTPIILLVVGAILAISAHDAIRRPILRRQALRNVVRRPSETLIMVGGALLGTAIITASFVIGDTIDGSISDIARTDLGPIDDVVVVDDPVEVDRIVRELQETPIVGTDGVIGAVGSSVVVATTGDERRAVPDATAYELDFDAARRFGGDAAATGLADSGATPSEGEAVVSLPLADELDVVTGDELQVFAFDSERTVTITAVLDRIGMAGLGAENLHLAPGTLDTMAGAADGPNGFVYVSRAGGVFDSITPDSRAFTELVDRYDSDPAVVTVGSWKEDLLEEAEQEGTELTAVFSSIGAFAVISGILLVVNIVVMLTEERRSQLGIMRALGLRRGHVVRIMGLEGSVYAIAAAGAGVLAGIGVGRAVAWAATSIVAGDGLDLQFQFEIGSLVTGGAIGLLVTLLTVWGASLRLSRLNIIAAIRELPNPRRVGGRGRAVAAGVGLAGAGGALTMLGVSGSAMAAMTGPAILVSAIVPPAGRHRRIAASIAGVASVAWGVSVFAVLPDTMRDPDISVFVAQGVVLVAGAIMTLTANDWWWRALLERIGSSRRTLPIRLGLTYPLARPGRTALLLGMYALVLFTIAFMSIITAVFENQAATIAAQNSGGFEIHLDTNTSTPLDEAALSASPEVTAVAGLSQVWVDVSFDGDSYGVPLTGVDDAFVQHGGPDLANWSPDHRTASDAWTAIIADPNLVAVNEFVLADEIGLVDVGDEFVVHGQNGAADRTVTVAAITSQDWLWNGVITSHDGVAATARSEVVPSRWYIGTDASDASRVATTLTAAFLTAGADAATFVDTIDEELQSETAFIRILESYLGLGLLIGVAGLGIVLVRAVRERRREIGMMRAMGLGADTVRRSFLVEALFLAGQGAAIGVTLGIVTGWQVMTKADAFGTGPSELVIPWVAMGIITFGPVVASLLAAAMPARRAARITPAVALRVTG